MGNPMFRKDGSGNWVRVFSGGNSNTIIPFSEALVYLNGSDFKNSPPTTIWNSGGGEKYPFAVNNFAYTTSSGSDGLGGVVFDGVDDSMNSVDFIYLQGKQLSIELKLNITSTGEVVLYEISQDYNFNNSSFIIYYDKTTNILTIAYNDTAGTPTYVLNEYVIDLNTTTHLTVTCNTAQTNWYDFIKLYVNGALVTMTNVYDNATRNITIGDYRHYLFSRNNSILLTKGTCYICRVYKRELSASEVLYNYNASL